MAIRKIVQYPDPILKQKSQIVTKFHDNFHRLLDDLAETMYDDKGGVGLAAPQVGILKRAFVADLGAGLLEIVNPRIVEESGWQIDPPEGCLSIPGLGGIVRRRSKVKMVGQDRFGEPVEFDASGYLARVFQHELDHLDGILFIDKAEKVFTSRKGEN